MSADGNSGRDRLLSRMGSSGLAVLLDSGSKESLVTAAACMVDECTRSTLDRSIAFVLDYSSEGVEQQPRFVVDDSKIDSSSIQLHLQSRLAALGSSSSTDVSASYKDGVFIEGSSDPLSGVVRMDKGRPSGDIKLSKSSLLLESQAIFSSARANACVWRGKWMYEVTLGTAGIQQLGWATISCPFTDSEGVGDASDSYAYDGRRVKKWSGKSQTYGEPWVVGDVIGCCIDLEQGQIFFYRNGTSLGMAYDCVRRMEAKQGYYPAISLSHGERCELNFGGRPFRYPIAGFLPLQAPPVDTSGTNKHGSVIVKAKYLFGCLQKLVQLGSPEVAAAMAPAERLRRFTPLPDEQFRVVGTEICKILCELLQQSSKAEYVVWGALVPFLTTTYRPGAPHDGHSVDRALDLLMPMLGQTYFGTIVLQIIECLAYGCRTSPLVLADSPFSASYSHLALACHLLQRDDFMVIWWKSDDFESCLEGLLTRKGPNKCDLESLIPTVWWPGSREEHPFSESNMRQIVIALSRAISRIEDLHFELCNRLVAFDTKSNATGSIFRTFLQHLVLKNRGAHRNMPPPGLSDNSVLVSVYTVLLRYLSEGLDSTGDGHGSCVPFLHKGGKRSFPVSLFVSSDPCLNDFARLGGTYSYLTKTCPLSSIECEEVEWEESSMDKQETRYGHDAGLKKPCCCMDGGAGSIDSGNGKALSKGLETRFSGSSNKVNETTCPLSPTDAERSYDGDMESKASSSGRVEPVTSTSSLLQKAKKVFKSVKELSSAVREEELLDKMVLLYHLGVTQNFKQASYHMQHQIQLMAQLDETDRQIRSDKTSSEQTKRLKEARGIFKEDLIDYVRQCTWYRVCLLSKWKQRGMYATCMWVAQLLVTISKKDACFSYVPEFYIETLVDCFHALRRSDPLYVPPSSLLQHGLSSFVTFLVTHFHDSRIVNAEIRDFLLQSISVLVQFKEYLVAIEACKAAENTMAGALLSAFDNRFWIPVSNILLRLCKGSGFGTSKSSHGDSCSPFFQRLLREKCLKDEKLFASFLNRLFNTLNWTVSEFSVSIKEMHDHDHRQVPEFQQRKCAIMFELSCNLERILEFFTKELPQVFLVGPEMNIIRLCELVLFVLNHTTSNTAGELFDSTIKQQGQSLEKVNRATILAPVVGIVLNLSAATDPAGHRMEHDIARSIASVDVSSVATRNFQYLFDYDWLSTFKGDPSLARLSDLNIFIEKLKTEYAEARKRACKAEAELITRHSKGDDFELGNADKAGGGGELCSICYACEENAVFLPCKHRSCVRCVSRHLLNNQRCFFCNAAICEVCPYEEPLSPLSGGGLKGGDVNS
ncbi:E3 ubiquitin-protein ligase RKP [Selaginella moellendorffii]|nr:E3 ubiquitin-protein ligase RKP [Selaginella moellendorffii]|eukprot:XP_002974307.2 E3 ubiquitin-protein ligase RKP [Selaginella moellendorffii]